MTSPESFDILTAVQSYIANATPERVVQDLKDSQFDEFCGVGPLVAEEKPQSASISFSTQTLLNAVVLPQGAIAVSPYLVQASVPMRLDGLAGNYEEMPLAA